VGLSCIRELANVPLATVEAAIQCVKTQRAVDSPAGLMVTLLRDYVAHGIPIPTPPAPGRTHNLDDGYAERVRAQLEQLAQDQDGAEAGEAEAAPEEVQLAAPPESPPPDEPPDAPASEPPDDHARLWSQVSGDLQRRMDRRAYRTWLHGANLVGLTESTATIRARSAYQRDRLERHEAALIGECLGMRLGRSLRVVITLGGDAESEELRASTPPSSREEAPPARAAAPPARPATPPAHPVAPPGPREGPRSAPPPAPPGGPPTALAAPAAPVEAPGCPPWISPALWPTVPPVLRAMLVGSELRGGEIYSAHPFWRKALDDTRYAEVLARLLAAAEIARSA
jgi:hypothetical protein